MTSHNIWGNSNHMANKKTEGSFLSSSSWLIIGRQPYSSYVTTIKFHSTSLSSSPAPSLPYCCHSLLITNTALIDWLVIRDQFVRCVTVCHDVEEAGSLLARWHDPLVSVCSACYMCEHCIHCIHTGKVDLELIVCTMFNCKIKVLYCALYNVLLHLHPTTFCFLLLQIFSPTKKIHSGG